MHITTEGATKVTLDFSPGIFVSTQRDEDGTDKQLVTLQVRTDGVIQMKLPDADFTTLTMALMRHARNEGILPGQVLLAEIKRSMSEEDILTELGFALPSRDMLRERISQTIHRQEVALALVRKLTHEIECLESDLADIEEEALS